MVWESNWMAECTFQVLITRVRFVDPSNRAPRDLNVNVSFLFRSAGIEFSKGAFKIEQYVVHVIAVVAALLTFYQMAKLGLVARRYRKAVRGLESEVHQLRNLPLADDEGSASPAGTGAQRGSPVGPSA